MVISPENVFSALIARFFGKKLKFSELEKLENLMKRECIFKKPALQKWKGREFSGGSRPSC